MRASWLRPMLKWPRPMPRVAKAEAANAQAEARDLPCADRNDLTAPPGSLALQLLV
jgi:hypothetical protein